MGIIEQELEKARLKAGLTELERNASDFDEILKRANKGTARILKIQYDAYVEAGFTETQAFEILKLNIQMQPAKDIQAGVAEFLKGLSKGGLI